MADVIPNPVFEGSEKRVEIDFTLGTAPASGLRALTREQLDELMTLAHCCIVSSRSNEQFDAYVLSESSLFVYPTKWVLKTCGTTRLLQSVPRLLELAGQLGVQPLRCKYTRASFLFPEQQPFPHTSFDDETAFLDQFFGHMDAGDRQSYVLGEQFHGLQWHVYIAGRHAINDPADHKATFNLELCMTELGEKAAKQFFRTDKFVSSAQTTKDTGIIYLKPGAVIDDYVFEPCGYSMNGIDRSGFITIHVTPEMGFSYASVEISGHLDDMVDPDGLIAAAINIFNPGKMSVAMSVDHVNADGATSWGAVQSLPSGYMPQGATVQRLACGGRVAYYTLGTAVAAKSPDSPTSILHHSASLLSVSAFASDSDQEAA
uniref:S-adenosylmethionine decarboxylase proenzyme n=1 Tax=Chlamydomonas leiostraca TaxID=1034604 RepID=A0A7S0R6E5_9CHLO|mmetsp:Transcript_14764/g.36835  ORF Transcript_14764/g.36835 Transcript_14764/m.36835 type:complete len:374 (+) Transcript_14764:314-1435(+)